MNIPEAIDCLNVLQGAVYGEMTYEQQGIQLGIEALQRVDDERQSWKEYCLPSESPAEQYQYAPDSVSDPRD